MGSREQKRTEIILLQVILPEFRGGNVHGNTDLASISGFFNGLYTKIEGVRVDENIWCETALITDISSILAKLLLGQSLIRKKLISYLMTN